MNKARSKGTQAERADRHDLYERSVQEPDAELDFIEETWNSLRRRGARVLCEDFCGTANNACAWVRRSIRHEALAIDLDGEVLEWGLRHHAARLNPGQRRRLQILRGNVLDPRTRTSDIVLAMNFSYYLFRTRDALRGYFARVHASLAADGIFFLDAFGGYDAARELVEDRDCGDFTYIWDQAEFNPIDSTLTCHIHFAFPDGSRIDRAFSYHWRLWTLPEIRELLLEAGFRRVDIYWEGTDESTGEGDGDYQPREVGDADAGWVCYIVAQR